MNKKFEGSCESYNIVTGDLDREISFKDWLLDW